MASLQEAFGCTFSETPFEIIDENFKLEDDSEDSESENRIVSLKNGVEHSCSCKEGMQAQEYTNIFLLIIIGLLLFMIIEKRMK